MRAHIPSYEVHSPRALSEALQKLKDSPGQWRPIAGGTDLMVVLETGKLAHLKWLNIWGLSELRGVRKSTTSISIGALTTYSELRLSPTLSREFPMLGQAAAETGAIAIQNRGTIGGNIANASPAADTPPALLAYDASVELVSTRGSRRVPYSEFHLGYKKTAMRPDELISRIHLKRRPEHETPGLIHYYRKVGTRRAQAISKVCFSGVLDIKNRTIRHIRIALGSVAATPMRCKRIEAELLGKRLTPELIARARAMLASEITPLDDIRSTGQYRLQVAGNLLEEFLRR